MIDMGLLERKIGVIIGGRNLSRSEASGEISAKFRITKKEAQRILRNMNR